MIFRRTDDSVYTQHVPVCTGASGARGADGPQGDTGWTGQTGAAGPRGRFRISRQTQTCLPGTSIISNPKSPDVQDTDYTALEE